MKVFNWREELPSQDGILLEDWFKANYSKYSNAELVDMIQDLVGHAPSKKSIERKGENMSLRKTRETMQRVVKKHHPFAAEAVNLSPEEVYDELLRRHDFYKKHDPLNVQFHVEIQDDRPIGLVGTGDWHVGHESVDYARLRDTLIRAANTDGVFFLGTGDYFDNYKAGSGRVSNGLYNSAMPSPEFQQLAAQYLLDLCADKMIGMVAGCHLDWTFQASGTHVVDELAASIGAISMRHGGMINLNVGNEEYRILLRHKFGGTTHYAARKAFDEYPVEEMDIVFLGHYHFNELIEFSRRSRDRIFLRTGGWKEDDEYGQKIGGYKGDPGMPLVILYPNERKMVPFHGDNLEAGLELLTSLRNR